MMKTRTDDEEEPQLKRQRIALSHCFSSNPYNQIADDNNKKKKKLKMVCASFYLPKDNPEKPLGEDSHFICSEAQTVGVADGVGGWAKRGIDSGEYARDLMTNAFFATLLCKEEASAVDPTAVLHEAYRRTAETELKGSSTACVVSHSDGVLRSANVGDSGFMVFRKKRLIYRSETQQRRFNCPFQLGNSERCERPESAVVAEITVEAGDVVVVGTDGLLDNVFAREVEEILERELSGNETEADAEKEAVALLVAEIAHSNSFNGIRDTPFSVAAREAGRSHTGGKVDDITVVACLIVPDDTVPRNDLLSISLHL